MSVADKLTKLTTDINSAYSAIQTKGGTVPEHKNTENLADAIVSISGGGSDPFKQQLESIATAINNSGKMSASYNKTYDTTDPITLYTPDASCQWYCIQYRSGGKFRIVWFPYACVGVGSGASYGVVNANKPFFISNKSTSETIIFSVEDGQMISDSQNKVILNSFFLSANTSQNFDVGTVFFSAEMNTIEDCATAIKNSSTTYTPLASTSFMGGAEYNGTGTSVVASNLIEFNRVECSNLATASPTYNIVTNTSGRQLSSDETIVVQGNA